MNLKSKNSSPCQYFPACGGCDFLDLDEETYREVKKKNLAEIFADQNFYDTSNVEWIWICGNSRRKIILQIDSKNRLGFFAKKSNSLVEIDECFIAEKQISAFIPSLKNFLQTQEQNLFTQAAITSFDNGLDVVLSSKRELNFAQTRQATSFAKAQNLNFSYRIKNDLIPIFLLRKNQLFYPNFKIDLDSEIFIQATKSGLQAIIKIIRSEIQRQSFEKLAVLDLYAGFGAYSFAIVDLASKISAFEGSGQMSDLINKNAAANQFSGKLKVTTRDLFINPLGWKELMKSDLVIINPPRNGASPQISEIAKSSVSSLIYISCYPANFLRDAKILNAVGFAITGLTAIDQFYGSRHLELVAIMKKA